MNNRQASRSWVIRTAAWVAGKLPGGAREALYRLGPLTGLIRRALSSAAPKGMSEIQVAAGPLQGVTLVLNLEEEKDLWLGNYELALWEAAKLLVQPGMTIFDVGANIGYMSLGLARLVGSGGRVIAIEPLPENVKRLHAHLALNNDLAERVKVIEAAAGEGPGRASFLVHASGGMGKLEDASGRQGAYDGQIEVSVVSLDSLVFDRGLPVPGLIKLDVEGGEALALLGARRLIRDARPVLFIEFHGPQAASQCWDMLIEEAYRVRRMGPGLPLVEKPGQLGWKAYVVASYLGELPGGEP